MADAADVRARRNGSATGKPRGALKSQDALAPGGATGGHVLLVEVDEATATTLAAALRLDGCEVELTPEGVRAPGTPDAVAGVDIVLADLRPTIWRASGRWRSPRRSRQGLVSSC